MKMSRRKYIYVHNIFNIETLLQISVFFIKPTSVRHVGIL